MSAGKLDKNIFIESRTETNVSGSLRVSYTDLSGNSPATPFWAEVISQKGAETFESARNNAQETIRVRIRYRDDVKNTDRIQYMGNYYNVIYVDHTARRMGYLWLTAEGVGVE